MNMNEKIKHARRSNLGISDKMFDFIVTTIITIFLIIVLYPIIYTLSSSFSSGEAVSAGRVILWPVDVSLKGYQIVLNNKNVWLGYANAFFYTITKTILSMIYTTLVAYVLSRKNFQGRAFFTTLYLIPMWFGGGLIPSYILRSDLGMVNSRWGYVFMTTVSIGNMIIIRTFFQSSIPGELLEAAKVDGITDVGYLTKVVLPLAKLVLSVTALYCITGTWNEYFGPLVYLRDKDLQPLQLVLRRIMSSTKVESSGMADAELMNQLATAADSMKYALIVVSVLPMLMLFPFVQKFFKQGVVMGSLKG
jgi:multiple sugar transport system permease protein/putative aldouronate transport system permease protein